MIIYAARLVGYAILIKFAGWEIALGVLLVVETL